MTPEQRIAQLEALVADLRLQMGNLTSSNTIPYDVEKAFKNRLSYFAKPHIIFDHDGDAVNNTQAVNEDGSGTYNVLKVPDNWLFITIDAEGTKDTKLGIPVFNQ